MPDSGIARPLVATSPVQLQIPAERGPRIPRSLATDGLRARCDVADEHTRGCACSPGRVMRGHPLARQVNGVSSRELLT